MKCSKVLFTLQGLKTNIGNYTLLSIIFANIISVFIFIFKGYKLLYEKIKNISKIQPNIKNHQNDNNNVKKPQKKKKISKKNKIKKRKLININKSNAKIIANEKQNKINELIKNQNSFPKFKIKKKKKLNQNYINNMKTEEISRHSVDKLHITKQNNLIKNTQLKLNNNSMVNESRDNNKNYKYNEYELNSLDYNKAVIFDKRSYIQYYFSLLKKKQLLIFTFYTYNDYNSKIIKFSLFLFSFALYYEVNILFFTDSTMHKIYEEKGDFNFIYQIPKILYSSIICFVINNIVTYLSLSEKVIISLKKNSVTNINEKISELIKCLKIKFALFYLIEFLLLSFFWYYISCFCAVYRNTQIHLIKNILICFGLSQLSQLYPLGLCLIPGVFRIPALRSKNKNKSCIYAVSKILQII